MNLESLAVWLGNGMVHDFIVEKFWVFPLMETFHFVGLSFMFGSLLVIDGRVLGIAKFISMKEAMKFIPIAMVAFAVNLISGYMFLTSDPNAYLYNIGFQWKMGMIVIAGINALWFWVGEHKELCQLADGQDAPFRAKVIALASLIIWVIVIVLGRMIPYTDF
jgi:hypothetical protein